MKIKLGLMLGGELFPTIGLHAMETSGALEQQRDDDEIVVTAQKRDQRLTDVGMTITAATGEQLATAGVRDIDDLAKISAGFSSAKTFDGY